MPRFNVKHPVYDQWRCYSTIVDDYITPFMERHAYQYWREREYGVHCGEIEDANTMNYEEAERRRKLHK